MVLDRLEKAAVLDQEAVLALVPAPVIGVGFIVGGAGVGTTVGTGLGVGAGVGLTTGVGGGVGAGLGGEGNARQIRSTCFDPQDVIVDPSKTAIRPTLPPGIDQLECLQPLIIANQGDRVINGELIGVAIDFASL